MFQPLLPRQVLDALLPELENRRGKLVVVLAGYKKPVEELMAYNEGLPSRFVQVGGSEGITHLTAGTSPYLLDHPVLSCTKQSS